MILEHADIRIDPAKAADFEAAILRGASTVIAQAKGFQGFKVNRSIESPGRYILNIYWDTLEDHTVGFRQSPAFAEWLAKQRRPAATPARPVCSSSGFISTSESAGARCSLPR